MNDELPTDPLRVPVFFLSYARTKQTKHQVSTPTDMNIRVRELYRELCVNVAQLVPAPTGEDTGFMDTELESGTRWRRELFRAVGSCQVFVALLTASYVRSSAWCAMEWDLFTQRKTQPRTAGEQVDVPPVLPVLWAPIKLALPTQVSEIQRFIPRQMPARVQTLYRGNGLFGLHHADREAYHAVVWALSLEIQALYYNYSVEPLDLPDTAGLRRTFRTDPTP